MKAKISEDHHKKSGQYKKKSDDSQKHIEHELNVIQESLLDLTPRLTFANGSDNESIISSKLKKRFLLKKNKT